MPAACLLSDSSRNKFPVHVTSTFQRERSDFMTNSSIIHVSLGLIHLLVSHSSCTYDQSPEQKAAVAAAAKAKADQAGKVKATATKTKAAAVVRVKQPGPQQHHISISTGMHHRPAGASSTSCTSCTVFIIRASLLTGSLMLPPPSRRGASRGKVRDQLS